MSIKANKCAHATPVRKNTPVEDGMQDLGLPVPVQTFLWRQIAPFIRPKLGKLHEASCMVSGSHYSFSGLIITINIRTVLYKAIGEISMSLYICILTKNNFPDCIIKYSSVA